MNAAMTNRQLIAEIRRLLATCDRAELERIMEIVKGWKGHNVI